MRRPIAVALLVALTFGCAQARFWPWPNEREAYSEQHLREDLQIFARRWEVTLTAMADHITESTDSRVVRRQALLSRIRIIPLVRAASIIDDVKRAFAAVAVLVVTLERYLEFGDGRAIFGEDQPRAIQATRELERRIFEIGRRFLQEDELLRFRTEVDGIAAANPIRGPSFAAQTGATVTNAIATVESGSSLAWVVNVPMTPFRALGGVSETAAAIADFNRVATAFTSVISLLPQQMRWELELLLFDFEDRDTTEGALAALEKFSASTSEAASTFERLPRELEALLAEAEPNLVQAQQTLVIGRELAAELTGAAAQVAAAGEAWSAILARDDNDGASREPGRVFDVREYAAAAGDIRDASAELRDLARELRTLADSEGLQRLLSEGVRPVEARARDLVDHAAWRGLLLLLCFFALLLLYRAVVVRLARGAGAGR